MARSAAGRFSKSFYNAAKTFEIPKSPFMFTVRAKRFAHLSNATFFISVFDPRKAASSAAIRPFVSTVVVPSDDATIHSYKKRINTTRADATFVVKWSVSTTGRTRRLENNIILLHGDNGDRERTRCRGKKLRNVELVGQSWWFVYNSLVPGIKSSYLLS